MSSYRSFSEMFLRRVAESPDREAFRYPDGNAWRSLTWAQTGERVKAIAAGLVSLGVEMEQRCAILSSTRLDWQLADFGILCAGAATTTIYPSSTPDETAYIVGDSGSVVCFAEGAEQAQKLQSRRDQLPALRKVVVFDGTGSADGWVMTLGALEDLGRRRLAERPGEIEEIVGRLTPQSLATLIYTSGTTGRPKGAELVHDAWIYEGEAVEAINLLSPDDLQYFWLPLAHVFGKVIVSAQLRIGFPTAIDGRIDKLVDNLAVVRPTFICAVPRIFEKVRNKVISTTREGNFVRQSIFNWAMGVGRQCSQLRLQGKKPSGWLAFSEAIADRLVFSKLKQRFGGRVRFFVSGSAPLSKDVAEFFHAAGILILEGYGLTETSAGTFINRLEKYKFGKVGPPMPGTEVKLAPEDAEVLIRGRGVMRGYHGLPDETRETLDAEGWLHTGDIGELDEDGFLRITDRKKDLIKTSGGKYVAPQALEGKLKALCPQLSHVLVHGNGRNFCSALICIDPELGKQWAIKKGLGELDYAALTASPEVQKLVQGAVDQLNAGLASYETIKRFAILPKDLSKEDGDLTDSMKIKRREVERKHRAILDEFYKAANEA